MKATRVAVLVALALTAGFALSSCGGKKNDSAAADGTKTAKASSKEAKANPESDFRVELTEDGAGVKILEYVGKSPDIVIPDTIEGMPVLEIANYVAGREHETLDQNVWGDWIEVKENNTIKSIVFPDSVRKIGRLDRYVALESVTLPKSLSDNGVDAALAFDGCTALKKVIFPEDIQITILGEFYKCSSLQSVSIPKSVQTICSNAFNGCSSLEEIIIPDGVESYNFGSIFWEGEGYQHGDYVFSGTKLPLKTQARLKQLGYKGSF